MAKLDIYRESAVLATVYIGEDTMRQAQLMAENKVDAVFNSPEPIAFVLGDYIQHDGHEFILNELPEEVKSSSRHYGYSAIFEGREYTLYNKQFMHLGASDFSYFGTAAELLALVVANINEIDAGWTVDTVDATEPRHFTFTNESCRTALSTVAEAFGLEYSFAGRAITLVETVGATVASMTLRQGKGNGLYTLTRRPDSGSGLATRVFGFGGQANLPADYRGGMRRLGFDPGKVENNIGLYGIIEETVIFDHIYPNRTGTVTASADHTTVSDADLDFDLNDVFVQGQAKIVFKSGELGGQEFDITSYNHSTKTIRFKPNQEESGYVLPNATFNPAPGDTYTLVGIEMPQSYIDAAEDALEAETVAYAETAKHPRYAYELAIDELHVRRNELAGDIRIGNRIRTVDTDMGIDESLRVVGVSYPLSNPSAITATIADRVSYTVAEKVRKQIARQEESIRELIKGSAELQRINSVRREELQSLIFDPDGYFDPDNIRPLSIQTTHIAVGVRSQEFSLSVIFKPNLNGNQNAIQWTAGVLTHFTIAENVHSWNLSAGDRNDLVAGTAYYIYARCNKAGTAGTIVLDTTQRTVDSDPTHYYFLCGVLSSVIDGIRWPTLTYGTTEINGGFIRTGRIESNDGKAWLDLTTSQFRLGDANGGLDWNVTEPNQLTIVGKIVATDGEIGGVPIIGGQLQMGLQKVTEIGNTTNRAITVRGTRNTHLLAVPLAAPLTEDVVSGEAYLWFGNPGGGGTPPPAYGNLEDLQNVADDITDGKYLRKVGGQWVGVDITFPDLSGYATQSWVNSQGFLKSPDLSGYATQAWATGQFVTQATDQLSLPGNKGWTGRHHFTGSLSIPQAAPVEPVAGQAYIWFGNPGGGGTPPPAYGNLEDLQNVADSIDNGKYLRKVGGEWTGVDITFPDLSGYATQSWVNAQGFIKAPDLSAYATQAWATGRFVTQATDQLSLPGNKGWTGRHHFTGALSIPQTEPSAPVSGEAYIWFGSPGSGSGDPSGGTLAGLDDVELASLANNQFLRYNSSTGKWVNSTFTVDLSGYATQSWVTAGFAPISHTHTIAQVTGLQSALDGKEAAFVKNTAFNKNFGTSAGTVAQGNDSRIVNGQTAFGWGNHAGLYLPRNSSYSGQSMNDIPIGNYFADLSTTVTDKPFIQVGAMLSLGINGGQLVFARNAGSDAGRIAFRSTSSVGTMSPFVELWTSGNLDPATFGTLAGANTWTGHNHFTGALSIPQSAPTGAHAGQAYVWFGSPGSGSGGGTSGTLAGLDDVALSSLANNQLLRYNSSTGKWVNFTASYAPASHTHPISQVTGLQSALDGKEPAFSKNTGFNRPFGTTANTVAQGNDSRIVNGQTAFGWGNHTGLYLPLEGGALTGNLRINTYLNIVRDANSYRFEISGTGFGDYNNIYLGRSDDSTGLYYGSGHQIWHAGNLSVGNGTLSLSTGAGLTGSASFSANQSGNTSFSISVASGYVLPTTGQVTNWNTAYGWGDYRGFGLGTSTNQQLGDFTTVDASYLTRVVGVNGDFFGIDNTHRPRGFLYKGTIDSRWSWMGVTDQGPLRAYIANSSNSISATVAELWHSGNITPVPTSRTIATGNHLTGGGNLSSDRTLSVAFTTNTYVMDSLGNPRIYFSHNTTTNDMIFRLSQSNGRFAFRNANNSERLRIESNGKIYSYAGIESVGKITCPVIEPAAFIVPATAPSSPESGKRYLWVS